MNLLFFQKEKDHMRRYLEKVSRAVMHMQRGIDQERRKNSNLRKQLHESDIIIVRNIYLRKSFCYIFMR